MMKISALQIADIGHYDVGNSFQVTLYRLSNISTDTSASYQSVKVTISGSNCLNLPVTQRKWYA